MAITRIGKPAIADVRGVNFRNIIINGGMDIAQRATSTASITGSGVFVIDRWKFDEGADATVTMSQETLTSGDAYNNGFRKSLKVLVTTADTSLASNQSEQLMQHVEAQNLQYLNFGTSGAKNLTLSFWYKSNVTGIHTVCIDKPDTTRTTCPLEFTVSSANTWEKHTLHANANAAVQGSSGAIANDNGTGFRVMWGLAYGSDYTSGTSGTWVQNGTGGFSTSNQQNIVAAVDNYVELTGVQLEVGQAASDFEFLPHDVNLHRCYRYCYRINGNSTDEQGIGGSFYMGSTSQVNGSFRFDPPMRAVPTLTEGVLENQATGDAVSLNSVFDDNQVGICNTLGAGFTADSGTPFTANQGGNVRIKNNASGFIQFDAEL